MTSEIEKPAISAGKPAEDRSGPTEKFSAGSSIRRERECWAILWRSKNSLDGERALLLGTPQHACRTLLFDNRSGARAHIANECGYNIKGRPDLRRQPFGWRMPVPVRVRISVEVMP